MAPPRQRPSGAASGESSGAEPPMIAVERISKAFGGLREGGILLPQDGLDGIDKVVCHVVRLDLVRVRRLEMVHESRDDVVFS